MAPLVITVPERLDEPFLETMRARMTGVADVSAVLLEGAPARFCLGMSGIAALAASREKSQLRRGLEAFADCLDLLLCCPRPTCAVVDGAALGGGLGLAAACDVILATERARFGLPEGLYGLAPSIIRPVLLRRLTPQQVNLLLFTAHARSADEAAGLGLVDRLVPVDRLEAARREIVRQLRRVRSEAVIVSRRWDAAEIGRLLRAGIEETLAALADRNILAALGDAASEDERSWRR